MKLLQSSIYIIFKREVNAFLNNLIAYIVFTVFLVGVGLFFWVFGGNVLAAQRGDMQLLFDYAPWFFLFLVPAICMRSFSEEMKTGTIELLATKPITDWQIILGKYLGAIFLVVLSLIPTLIYYFTLQSLTQPAWSLDSGPIWGAYLGLLGLGAIFVAIGIFCSAITQNQVIAFLLGVFLSFFFFFGFEFLAELEFLSGINDILSGIGGIAHFESISRGVIDTRDIVYFISFVAITLLLTRLILSLNKK